MEFLALVLLILAAVGVESLVYARLGLRHLHYSCRLSAQEAAEGDELELIEVVENRKWLPIPWLKAEITASRALLFAGSDSVVTGSTRFVPSFFVVRGHQRIERRWKVRCLLRGVHGVEKITLVATDLFGGVTLSAPVAVQAMVSVLPAPFPLRLPAPTPRFLWGDTPVPRHLLEDPFFRAGVREYAPGDPLRRVHWAATAKEGRLMVYRQECTARRSLCVLLNVQSRPDENGPALDSERVEDALRVCAALFLQALGEEVPLRFFANAPQNPGAAGPLARQPVMTKEDWGRAYTHRLMGLLCGLRLESTESFPAFLSHMESGVAAGEVVLVTAYASGALAPFVRAQLARGARVQVLLLGWAPEEGACLPCPVHCLYAPGDVPGAVAAREGGERP